MYTTPLPPVTDPWLVADDVDSGQMFLLRRRDHEPTAQEVATVRELSRNAVTTKLYCAIGSTTTFEDLFDASLPNNVYSDYRLDTIHVYCIFGGPMPRGAVAEAMRKASNDFCDGCMANGVGQVLLSDGGDGVESAKWFETLCGEFEVQW
jgi:hypothetical protein